MKREDGRPAGIVLILVLVAGLASSLLALGAEKGRAMIAGFSLGAVADGTATSRIAHLLNADLLGGAGLAETARVTNWLAFGDLGAQVRQGCAGWLFLREELDSQKGGEAALAARAAMAAEVARLLAARNIHLVVTVTPDKSRMMAAALCGLRRAASSARRIDDFQVALAAGGVDALDLRPAIAAAGDAYYHTDTHWNEVGARAAARAIAEHLASLRRAPDRGPDVAIAVGERHERLGDLIRLAGLDDVGPALRPKGDMVAESRITLPAVEADDLLGDMVGPPVAVIGSSYARNGNFIGFLAAALAAPIADMARDGAAFAGAAMPYFADAAFRETPPRVVVWEIPERVLDSPLTADEIDWAKRLGEGAL